MALLFVLGGLLASRAVVGSSSGYDWTRYDHDNGGSGFTTDPGITTGNASSLAARSGWPHQSANLASVSAQPIVANGLVYWGDWNGYEHATPVGGGADTWSKALGTTQSPSGSTCASRPQGIGDAGVIVDNIVVGGQQRSSVLFIGDGGNGGRGDGNAEMFALDAFTGTILWHTDIGASPSYYMWSSPLYHSGSIYEGIASRDDDSCGKVQGGVIMLDAATGTVQHFQGTVPNGCKGASVWGSPTLDAAADALYVVTGNGYGCSGGEPLSYAIVKLDATSLAVKNFWQDPPSQRVAGDDDFGSVPILLTGTVSPGGAMRQLVGAVNKSGIFYVWARSNLAAGPVWQYAVGTPYSEAIAPPAFDGTRLYVASKKTTISGTTFAGSLRAFDPNNLTGGPLWQKPFAGAVWCSVTAAPGIVVTGAGTNIEILNSSTGTLLRTLKVTTASNGTEGKLWSAPVIANGVLYEGDSNGFLYAYSPGGA